MKVPVLSSLILLLGLSSQLPAIERPKGLDDEQPNDRPAPRQEVQNQERLQPGPEADADAIRPAEAPAAAWLGVLSEPADETLSVHLGFEAGVVLSYVAAGSPAATAGLAQHDIVTEVDGVAIADQNELRDAIQAQEPGDEVTLTVISKGQKGERKVLLGERPEAPPALGPGAGGADQRLDLKMPDLEGLEERFPDLQKRMKDLEGLLPGGVELQGQLDKHMKRLEKQLRELENDGGLNFHLEMLDNLPQADNKRGFNFDFKASSSFKFFDDAGSVEMKMKDGGKEVVVKDKEDKILFEGPWDTQQDKAAAPEEIRERVEKMNNGNRFNFRLEKLPKPEMEFPRKEKQELE